MNLSQTHIQKKHITKWKQHRDQLDYGIDTRSQKYKSSNEKDQLLYDSTTRYMWSPEDFVSYESHFFTGD